MNSPISTVMNLEYLAGSEASKLSGWMATGFSFR
jgi:hypothetical protein